MPQAFRDIELVQLRELPGPSNDRLADTFTVHSAIGVKDVEAFVAPLRDRIRGLVVSGKNPVPASLIDALPHLEVIVCRSAGIDKIDLERCRSRGIVVTNASTACADDVADMALMLMLAVARGLVVGDRFVRDGAWESANGDRLWVKVSGKTIGIVGLGTIGKAIAKRAAAMGMRVLYNNRRARTDVPYAYVDTVRELAERSDFLVLACPGGPETRHLVDAPVLAALGREGFLINIARGSVVDEAALVHALQTRTIAGAGLDVFEAEPKVPPSLRELRNVVLSPHTASGTKETQYAMGQLSVDTLIEHFSGRQVPTLA